MIEPTRDGEVLVLRMAHGKASAMDLEFCRAIEAAFSDASLSDARAVVLTGTKSIYSAGVDLLRLVDGGAAYVREFIPALIDSLHAVFACERPVVAAVNGHAIAGGAILAFACERRVMSTGKATFGVPELRVGVPFPQLALEIVRAAVAPSWFETLVTTGAVCGPDDCLARGFVHELAAPEGLLARAIERARELAAIPPSNYALVKRLMRRPTLALVERDRARFDDAILAAWSSAETLDAVRAYVARTLKR